MRRLPEAWIAPPATRELRELVRRRDKLCTHVSACAARPHAVLANHGMRVPVTVPFGAGGTKLVERAALSLTVRSRVDSVLRLIDSFNGEIGAAAKATASDATRSNGTSAKLLVPSPATPPTSTARRMRSTYRRAHRMPMTAQAPLPPTIDNRAATP